MHAEGLQRDAAGAFPLWVRRVHQAQVHLKRVLFAAAVAVALGLGSLPVIATSTVSSLPNPPGAVVAPSSLGWSDPIPVARTATAVPPAVAVVGDHLHVFWIDGRAPGTSTGDLWHTVLSPDGRPIRPASRIRIGVDARLAFPAATSWNGGVAAAWMSRSAEGVTTEIGVWDGEGTLRAVLRLDPTPREEAGRIALSASVGTLHAAWSQFDGERRQVWYVRIRAGDLAHRAPIAVAEGDAPALLLTPRPRLFWWETAGAGAFRLMTGGLDDDRVHSRRALTGTISLVAPLPAVPAAAGREHIVLVPTVERAFSTAGQLYAMRLDAGGGPPARVLLLAGSRVSDVSLAAEKGTALIFWSQGVRRRQNSELFAARVTAGGRDFIDPPSRLTYTIPGSLRPAAAIIQGHAAGVWLEVAGFGEFTLSYGTSAAPRRHRFLLGITELDLFRPGALLAFAGLAALSTLPIALLFTAATLLPAAVFLSAAQMVAAPFARLEALLRRPAVRIGALVAGAVVIQVVARDLIPGRPGALLLAIPPLCATPPVAVLFARSVPGPVERGLAAVGLVLLGMMVALFPWGAAQLSQF